MRKIIVISGAQGEGKTTRCHALAKKMHQKNFKVGGFIAPGTWKNGQRYSFHLLNLITNETYDFASREEQEGWEQIHSFYFNPLTIKKGEEILRVHSKICDWLFIDEIGKFDIKGKVWGPILHELLKQDVNLVLSVRENFVEGVVEHFGILQDEILKESDFLK